MCVHVCVDSVSRVVKGICNVLCYSDSVLFRVQLQQMLPWQWLRGCVALGALIHSEAELLFGWHSETYVCAQKDTDTDTHTQIYTQALDNKLLQLAKT